MGRHVAAGQRVKVKGVCFKRMHVLAIFAKSRKAGRQEEQRGENSGDLRRRSWMHWEAGLQHGLATGT